MMRDASTPLAAAYLFSRPAICCVSSSVLVRVCLLASCHPLSCGPYGNDGGVGYYMGGDLASKVESLLCRNSLAFVYVCARIFIHMQYTNKSVCVCACVRMHTYLLSHYDTQYKCINIEHE